MGSSNRWAEDYEEKRNQAIPDPPRLALYLGERGWKQVLLNKGWFHKRVAGQKFVDDDDDDDHFFGGGFCSVGISFKRAEMGIKGEDHGPRAISELEHLWERLVPKEIGLLSTKRGEETGTETFGISSDLDEINSAHQQLTFNPGDVTSCESTWKRCDRFRPVFLCGPFQSFPAERKIP